MVNPNELSIARNKLNTILVVDKSKSMGGQRMREVNAAIQDIIEELKYMQQENCDVDYYLSVIAFDDAASLVGKETACRIDEFDFKPIKAGGWTNIENAYIKLAQILNKKSKQGIMPDYGGLAPIIVLLTDGHVTHNYYVQLDALRKRPWYRCALKYGIAIGLNDNRTIQCLQDFVSGNGDVLSSYQDANLKEMLKTIVLTSSKVRSQSRTYTMDSGFEDSDDDIRQQIKDNLKDMEDIQWH